MKVLFLVRNSFDEVGGGDRTQVINTKKFLESKFSIVVDLKKASQLKKKEVAQYDLVHAFNHVFIDDFAKYLREAFRANMPVVFSTIFWPTQELQQYAFVGLRKWVHTTWLRVFSDRIRSIYRILRGKNVFENFKIILLGELKYKAHFFQKIDILLPNSKSEYEELLRYFNLKERPKFFVVVNGIDPKIREGLGFEGRQKKKLPIPLVVCAARIDERKNLRRLVMALSDQPFRVVIAGEIPPESLDYAKSVKGLAGRNIEFVGKLTQNELFRLFDDASVHVLASWFETPGLSNLEAAAFGCQLVVTDRGSTKDYFKDYAYYCNPLDEGDILKKTKQALLKGKNRELAAFVRSEYTWEIASNATFLAYGQALRRSEV